MAKASVSTAAEENARNPAKPKVAPSISITSVAQGDKFLKMLIYGDYGVGKTWLAGTASDIDDMNDVILINAEAGELTLSEHGSSHKFGNIDLISVRTFKQVATAFNFLRAHCKLRDEDDIEKLCIMESKLKGVEITTPKKYRTVIIDSLTEVEAYCLNQLLGITDSISLDEEVQAAEWSEYKKNNSMVTRLVRSFRDLPMHVILTCARQYTQDESKKFLYSPQLTGKLAGSVRGFVDIVGFLVTGSAADDGSIPRKLYIQPNPRFAAKCRIGSCKQPYFDNPTISSIMEQIGYSKKVQKSKS